ncbi:ion transporter [Nocardioides sp. NPDC051685]|uniref:ion transporter n=1 Tax=Nocardioides sp. NPDC051685 TaxID=3364334 RepID=UPI0037B532E6
MSSPGIATVPTRPARDGRETGTAAGPPVTVVDWLMLALAIASVAAVVWVTFWDVSQTWYDRVVIADYIVCGIFAIEFLVRWLRSGLGWKFPLIYWYELLGMIPLGLAASPAFRSFRLLRIVLILLRLMRAADRAFGDRVSAYVVGRFSGAIVNAIRKPITVAVLDEVIAVIQTGNYTRHISSAIEENRAEIDTLIIDLIRQDQAVGKLRYLPFHDDVVRLVADTVLRLVDEGLADPRVHEIISDAIRESAKELRENIGSEEYAAVKRDQERFGK